VVDVIKCPISEPTFYPWEYVSTTPNQFWLKYEIGIAIGVPHIVWVAGPYKGSCHDGTIAKVSGIKDALGDREAALADKSYRYDKFSFIAPHTGHRLKLPTESRAFNYLVYSARSSVERAIRRIRNGRWTKQVFRLGAAMHAELFHIQCRLTNWCLIFEPLG
jgi:hypothetical protein